MVTRNVYYDVSVPQGIRIETVEQLANIGLVEEYPAGGEYYLGNDIDLSVLYEKGEDRFELLPGTPYVWRSIGSTCRECGGPLAPSNTSSADYHILPLLCKNMECSLFDESQPPFSGTLHGNGKTISGLKLSGGTKNEAAKDGGAREGYAGAYYIGLFGYLNNAYIHDLTVEVANTAEDPRIAYNGTSVRPSVAALAAVARSSRIKDITLRAAEGAALYVTAALTSAITYNYAGGAVGFGYMTDLTNITSSLPLDVDGPGYQYVGGIAGTLNTGLIRNANMTSNITVKSETTIAVASWVAGICPSATAIRNCTVTMDALILNAATTTGASNASISVILSGIGGGLITDCFVDIPLIRLCLDDTIQSASSPRPVYVGGIGGSSSNNTERCRARFDTLEVIGGENALHGASYIGGLTGMGSGTGKVIDSAVEGEGQITVDFSAASTTALYVGGIAGQGNVSRSKIADALTIDVTTGTTGIVYAGGLTGNGVAEYSSIGSPENRATLNVTKNAPETVAATVQALIGGISGQAQVTATLPFRYNYAFCDVTLTTKAGSSAPSASNATYQAGVTVGGLAGAIFAAANTVGSFTESYAVGSVILTNNFAGTETNVKVYAGGIAAHSYIGNAGSSQIFISKCAALNSLTINGSNSTATKTWRRVAYPAADTDKITFSNNITSIADTQADSPGDGPNTANGLYVADITEDTFFDTLGWSRDVWEWDAASGYPVLR